MKLKKYVADLLRQGLAPEKVALAITGGLLFSTIPVFIIGLSSILCVAFAYVFKLNLGLVQLSNLLGWPLQVLFFIPFMKSAEILFRFPPLIGDYHHLIALFKTDFWGTFMQLGYLNLAALVVWAVFSGIAGWGVYWLTLKIVKAKRQ